MEIYGKAACMRAERCTARACGDGACTVLNHGEFESVLGPYTPPKGAFLSVWALTSGINVRMRAERPQPSACGVCTCTVVHHSEFERVIRPYTPPKGVVLSFWALTSGVIVRMSAERPQSRACGGRKRTVVNHGELGRRTRPRTPQRGAFGPHRRQKAA